MCEEIQKGPSESKMPDYKIFSSSNLPNELKEFGGIMMLSAYNGENKKGDILMSDNIPDRFRPYFALHESLCVPNCGTENHCINATKLEIEAVPIQIRGEYISYRISFYKGLLNFFKNNRSERNDKIAPEVEKTLKYLEGISTQYSVPGDVKGILEKK